MTTIHMDSVLQNFFCGPIRPFGAKIEYRPICRQIRQGSINPARKVLSGICMDYARNAGGSWKGDLRADVVE